MHTVSHFRQPASVAAERAGEVVSLLSQCPLFKGLNRSQVKRLSGLFNTREFAPGQYLFRAGEAARFLFVITRGEASVRVPVHNSAGDEVEVVRRSAPDPLGLALLGAQEPSCLLSAQSVGAISCLWADIAELSEYLDSDHDVGNIVRGNAIQLLSRHLIQFALVLGMERSTRF